MRQQYIIDLQSKRPELESYEIDDTNLGEIRIQSPDGMILQDIKYKVELSLSPEAMIGLGTSLIRKGIMLKGLPQESFNRDIEQVQAINSNTVVTNLGIYLMPESCGLMVSAKVFGKVEDIIKKLKSA